MMGRQTPGQERLFYEFSLDDVVPTDHLVRRLDAVLETSWVHRELAPFYSAFGRPSIDPKLMIRMLIVGIPRPSDFEPLAQQTSNGRRSPIRFVLGQFVCTSFTIFWRYASQNKFGGQNMSANRFAHPVRSIARVAAALPSATTALVVAWLALGVISTQVLAEDMAEQISHPIVDVAVDEARVVRMNRPPASVVIGNPLIADALVEENGVIVLLGRNYGTTNLIALDVQGEEIASYDIVVRTSGRNAVSLFKGTGRIALNCSPRCETELDVGDNAAHFEALRSQIESKTTLSQGQADIAR